MSKDLSLRARLAQLRMRRWLRACDYAGNDVFLEGAPTVSNGGRMRVGERFHLASRPVQSHMSTTREGRLEIGDDVSIAHGAAIVAHRQVSIGDGTRIGPFVMIMDTDFHVVGDRSERHDRSAPIAIGREVRIGSHVAVLRGSVIHDGAFIVAGSVVSGVIPAGARAGGVPASVLRGEESPRSVESSAGVSEVVMRTFGLLSLPAPEDGPSQIPQWDSLGTLSLLLALEEVFGVTLSEDEIVRVASVADLTSVVDRASAGADRGPV